MYAFQNFLITNIINAFFVTLWFCCLVPETKYEKKKTLLGLMGACAVMFAVVIAVAYRRYFTGAPATDAADGAFVGFLIVVALMAILFHFFISPLPLLRSLFLFSLFGNMWTVIFLLVPVITGTYMGAGSPAIWSLRILLNLAFLIPYLLFVRTPLYQYCANSRGNIWQTTGISFAAFFLSAILVYYYLWLRSRDRLLNIVILATLAFIVIVHVMIFYYIPQTDRIARLRQIENHEKLMLEQIHSYEKMMESARQTRHDFRHHNLVVMEYAKRQDYQSILSYLQEYEEREIEKYANPFCGNHVVNTVLSVYVDRCKQLGIEVRTDIRLGKLEGISDYDLVSILANILENAVNGCMRAEGTRTLAVSILQKGTRLVLMCKNTCVSDILFEDGLPRNRERDGVGVESILACAAKYGGDADFSASDDLFTCRVLLNDRGGHSSPGMVREK